MSSPTYRNAERRLPGVAEPALGGPSDDLRLLGDRLLGMLWDAFPAMAEQ